MTDKIFEFLVNSIRQQEVEKLRQADNPRNAITPQLFKVDKQARELIKPCERCALHHRTRETHYIRKLEEAETKLRAEGVSVDVFDSTTGTYMNPANAICSGNVTGALTQQFQPRIDQRMLDDVKNAKAKMLEHRGKAEQYEQYLRAFRQAPQQWLRLNINDITFFRLEEPEE